MPTRMRLNILRIQLSSKHVTVHMQQTVWQHVFIQTPNTVVKIKN